MDTQEQTPVAAGNPPVVTPLTKTQPQLYVQFIFNLKV